MDQPPGRMAMLADDQGATFWVITLDPDFYTAPGCMTGRPGPAV